MIPGLALGSMLAAAIPCSLFLGNFLLYRRPPGVDPLPAAQTAVSILIPARDEEAGIEAAVAHALRSTGVAVEVLVMDDASTDHTAALVEACSRADPRVRLLQAPPLPAGWNGKQHACWALAHAARSPLLCFVDADVRLAPLAVARMAAFQQQSGAALVSGFPHQQTETWLEWLLLPLIHFVLLGLLPFAGMRRYRSAGFAAGCGQFLLVSRDAYFHSGGHAAIRETMHDGLRLPRLLREHGFRTDLADLTDLAECRMYRTAGEVWRGLGKNATEGLAAPGRIVPLSLLLLAGQILPWLLLLVLLARPALASTPVVVCVTVAVLASLLPRFLAAWRYRQSLRSAVLHPVGVAVLLVLQWQALLRRLTGRTVTWRARSYRVGDPVTEASRSPGS